MALFLCLNSLPSLSSLSSATPSLEHSSASTVSRFQVRFQSFEQKPSSLNGVSIGGSWHNATQGRATTVIVKAVSDADSTEPQEGNPEKSVSVEKLPLESKEQQKLEQKIRMKLAKKIRLRRKRLLRKRKLRKKGRWPPSKMNKLKNV